MPDVPIASVPAGSTWTAERANHGWWLASKPAALLRASAIQAIPDSVFTPITFDIEDLDTDPDGVGGHSTTADTSRYTARYPGWYRVAGGVTWAGSATGRRATQWSVNGVAVNASQEFRASGGAVAITSQAVDLFVSLTEGDYVELLAWQDSGGALNTFSSAANQSWMAVEWIRTA